MELLKDQYFSPTFYKKLAAQLKVVYPALDTRQFVRDATDDLESLALMQRMVRTSETCRRHFPDNFRKSLKILYALAQTIEAGFAYLFMPDFVARYGEDHGDLSLLALRDFTQYSSSELAIRTFLARDFEATLNTMLIWSRDDNYHVRRLASEGSRPRLPWARQVPQLLADPEHTRTILTTLCQDDEKYVQKSVANHLNDISKDHPDWVVNLAKSWDRNNKNTAWIVKHGSRSLIKKGHKRALSLFGVAPAKKISVRKFKLNAKAIKMGDTFSFSFALHSDHDKPQKLVVDYKLHFVKKSGALSAKVFKLKESLLPNGESIVFQKHYVFQDYTTRKHYEGNHLVEIIVNGESMAKKRFMLSAS